MANRMSKEIRSIFTELSGEQLSDGLRNTLTILAPLIVFFYLGMPQLAAGVATGTLLIANTDLPGNRSDKLQGAWLGILLFPMVAVITVLCLSHIILLALWIGFLTFSLMMCNVFGQRIGAIGTLGVILATFTIGLHPNAALNYGLYILVGVIWYHLVSLTQIMLLPYRSLTRALKKCTRETAALMKLRASGYDPSAPLGGFNERNIRLHLKVNGSHELIRRLLLSDNLAMRAQSIKGKELLAKSMALIDLYEQVSAVHHDYPYLRSTLAGSTALELIGDSIICLAEQLLKGAAVDHKALLDDKIARLTILAQGKGEKSELIGKLLANLLQTRLLVDKVNGQGDTTGDQSLVRFQEFLPEGGFNWRLLLKELNIGSPVFRFALRLAILLCLSILILFVFPSGSYGYWLPLTLIVVSRPSYGPTKKRNIERVMGTLTGLVIGWVVLQVSDSNTFRLFFSAAFLYTFFVFFYARYWLSAMGITAAVVISLAVYHGNPINILSNRLLFTLLGCTMGVLATFLFPIWQSGRLKDLFVKVLVANRDYLYQVSVAGENGMHQVRLARKCAYQALSVLSEAMLLNATEPKWKRVELSAARQVQLLCFQCNGLIAAMGSGKENRNIIPDQQLLARMDKCVAECIKSDIFAWKAGTNATGPDQSMKIGGVVERLHSCFSK